LGETRQSLLKIRRKFERIFEGYLRSQNLDSSSRELPSIFKPSSLPRSPTNPPLSTSSQTPNPPATTLSMTSTNFFSLLFDATIATNLNFNKPFLPFRDHLFRVLFKSFLCSPINPARRIQESLNSPCWNVMANRAVAANNRIPLLAILDDFSFAFIKISQQFFYLFVILGKFAVIFRLAENFPIYFQSVGFLRKNLSNSNFFSLKYLWEKSQKRFSERRFSELEHLRLNQRSKQQ
jgi:hypothetical protein